MKRLKITFLTLLISLIGFSSCGLVVASGVASAASQGKTDACAGLTELDPTQTCGTNAGQTTITSIVRVTVDILSIIIGVAAVIMVMVAGFKYITSAGNSTNISSAKTTLIYALVGLFIAALAQFLVHFVLSAASKQ
jgi:Type IV secretion system pilin